MCEGARVGVGGREIQMAHTLDIGIESYRFACPKMAKFQLNQITYYEILIIYKYNVGLLDCRSEYFIICTVRTVHRVTQTCYPMTWFVLAQSTLWEIFIGLNPIRIVFIFDLFSLYKGSSQESHCICQCGKCVSVNN